MKSVVAAWSLSLSLSLSLLGCASKEEQLIALKRENRAALDGLYARYGGGALASEIQKETARGADDIRRAGGEGQGTAVEVLNLFGNAASEIDRLSFEEQCAVLGLGERPAILNDKARAFFADAGNVSACEGVSARGLKIAALERELGQEVRR